MVGPFGSVSSPDPERTARIKAWAREALGVDAETGIMVTQLRCTEPGCPPVETAVAVMYPSGARQYKIHKPASEVLEDDVQGLARESG